MSSLRKEYLVDALILVAIFIFLSSYFTPNFILSGTTASGGDMGSHNYLAKYMKEYLLPHFRLSGWSPDWYAGFPMFTFYFPLAYAAMAAISVLVPLQVAFKIITVAGTFLLPFAAYVSMKKMGLAFPVPLLAALFTLPFLFNENNSMYGGNIPSTLAGEFSFSLALPFMLLFMAWLYDGIKKNRFAGTAALLAVTSLLHLIPVIAAVATSSFFLLRDKMPAITSLAKTYLLAFSLAGFWAVPLLANFSYSIASNYSRINDYSLVYPNYLMPFLLLAGLGAALAWKRKEGAIIYLTFSAIVSLALYLFLPEGHIWNTRFLPFYYLFSVLVAAYGASCLVPANTAKKWLIVAIAIIFSFAYVHYSVGYIDDWIRWNYTGFEGKPEWKTFNETNAFLSSLPEGRVFHEYSEKHNAWFGTPRALEDIPYFTNKPGMEGLLIESALSSPYHFFLQSELSVQQTCPIVGLRCAAFNVTRAMPHISLFNIRYIVATTDELKGELGANANFTLLKNTEKLSIYEFKGAGNYVSVPEYEPVIYPGSNWKELSVDWMRAGEKLPIIYTDKDLGLQKIRSLNGMKKVPAKKCDVNETITNGEIGFTTSCIGVPHLVKISYFPNWQSSDADIYAASPSFMAVVPRSERVVIRYGTTWADLSGQLLSVAGILWIAAESVRAKAFIRKAREFMRSLQISR
ncbi:MAG: hypothetical protein HY365_01815 [Candidatus Aenigmarchaeota archaeon]|nr:hypothetical protein [Candidatus Aenigmarchaeota archaeon]